MLKRLNYLNLSAIFLLFCVSFIWRFYGLLGNYPFWVDEFSSAFSARMIMHYGLSYFGNPSLNIEYNNILANLFIALFFKMFGLYEWAARLPFVIIGALVPGMVYLLAEKVFNRTVAISAGLLTAFSYFEIVWSRQARGYVLTQLLVVLTLSVYVHILVAGKKDRRLYFLLAGLIFAGLLTHFSYAILIVAVVLHSIAINFHTLKKRINISFLALLGLIGTLVKKARVVSIFALYIPVHIGVFTFLFAPYSSRYLLPIFPFLFIFAAVALEKFMNATVTVNKFGVKQSKMVVVGTLLLTLFIIASGNKFVTRPRSFYSVNHDFREIALIDYNKVYGIIKEKGKLEEGHTAVIDTWHDRLYWYIGNDYYPSYLFRWTDDPGTTNGLARQTTFLYNTQGEKIIPRQRHLGFVGDLADLMKVKEKYPRGFIFIDDATMPRDVIVYAQNNLNKEIYLDHYPLDDNPYSIWPATLYSWGIE